MYGILLYENSQKRFVVQEIISDVIPEDARSVPLHCGDQLSVLIKKDTWQDTRIEKNSDDDLFGWYFVGLGTAAPLTGHYVKI